MLAKELVRGKVEGEKVWEAEGEVKGGKLRGGREGSIGERVLNDLTPE